MSLFVKKASYNELIRTLKYIYAGVDIFSDDNRTFIKKVNYKLGFNVSYNYIENADLYVINGKTKKFKLVIAPLKENVRVVSFLSNFQFLKATNSKLQCEYSKQNDALLKEWVCNQIAKEGSQPDVYYSYNYLKRVVITMRDNMIISKFEELWLNPDAEIDFPLDLQDINDNVWGFQNIRISYFDTIENAVQQAKMELAECYGGEEFKQ